MSMESLRDEAVDNVAVDVGEAEVAAAVAVGEALVIEAEEVEHGGLQIVDVDAVLDGFETNSSVAPWT